MNGRGVSSRRTIEKQAMEGDKKTVPDTARATARDPEVDRDGVPSDMEIAEERGAERLRARLRDMLDDRRRIVRLGEQQIEVVEVSAVEDLLGEGTEERGG